MKQVEICVGSSCHISGSAYVINTLRDCIEQNNLGDQIELKASFCMGECLNGVCVSIDGVKFKNINPTNVNQLFLDQLAVK